MMKSARGSGGACDSLCTAVLAQPNVLFEVGPFQQGRRWHYSFPGRVSGSASRTIVMLAPKLRIERVVEYSLPVKILISHNLLGDYRAP